MDRFLTTVSIERLVINWGIFLIFPISISTKFPGIVNTRFFLSLGWIEKTTETDVILQTENRG